MTIHPRRRRPDDRPDAILDAALAVFTDVGYDRATVEEIARRARVSKGTVYLYFTSKKAMIEALVEQSSAQIADAAAALIRKQPAGDPELALRAVFRLLFKTISDPDVSAATRIVIAEGARFPELAAHYRARVIETGHGALEALVAKGAETGAFRKVDLDVANRALIGPAVAQLLMATLFRAPGDVDPDPDQMAEASLELILNGLKPRD
jgi:AcrR family transcriptional regulator